MNNEIETTYEAIYNQILHFQLQLEALSIQAGSWQEEDQEQLIRMSIALQASKDILENMLTPGKKLNFIYEKGMFSLEMFDEK
ncbi:MULTISPECIES: hypothetical protein [Niallia]|jgi:hypothetical protein|uniref:Uncharacterized protein n=1 Tax=Niallia circulans TaxID=1397 RepID=A0A268FDW1_NIACI|nr:hypothetical protein [Niallia circulans]AYV65543.1 hypothetical protein C2I06_00885 [Niallia circulans]NRG26152.1 hypothetical protein [Niallia circulans]PAD83553.1 hypothetical protein CHH57_09220 [Niallia circulans]QJX61429.1 hypothetical protein HLK66_07040 [Niallia circulans]UQZ74016.1 hypothetical protein C2I17_05220 [Niallia circulans]